MLKMSQRIGALFFCALMAIGTITGFCFFARPRSSALEKRDLAAFPAFSLASFLDGRWFSDISLWYSDTYPGRDSLLAANRRLKKLEGIAQDEQLILAGGTPANADTIGGSTDGAASDADQNKGQFDQRDQLPENNVLADEIQNQLMEGLLVKDGAVYAGYYFNEDSYQVYTSAIERAAQMLDGVTTVYSILVPNNSGVMLDEATRSKLGGSDQKQAIDYYYSHYSGKVHPVGTIDTLLEHSNEYLYFRSDHHWTPLGAYYVYRNFCEVKGIEPEDKESLEQVHFEPFLGSYASQLPAVDFNDDSIDLWIPSSGNTMKIFSDASCNPDSADFYEHPIINTDENIDMYNQYMRLIAGDQPFSMIDNPAVSDGSSCLVVKESYGNAFIPWLADHYDKVYIMDFRKVDIPIAAWCKEHEIQDLILINNIQLAASASVAGRYDALMQ